MDEFLKRMPRPILTYFSVFTFGCITLIFHNNRLPHAGPEDFVKGDSLIVKVQNLASVKSQLTYIYYSLSYCMPKGTVDAMNQGINVRKDLIKSSPYEFKMLEPQTCIVVCRATLNAKDVKEFKRKIDDEYRVNMILDNLPLVMPYNNGSDMDSLVYQHGFPVGAKVRYGGKPEHGYFIYNHLAFTVKYHKNEETDAARIVGFDVKPFSVKHGYEGVWNDIIRSTDCGVTGNDSRLEVEDGKEIIYTYDVEFQESEIKWDTYLDMTDNDIHWYSFSLSGFIVMIYSALVGIIIPWPADRDISKYDGLEAQEVDEDHEEETDQWILVLGDVFRPPTNSDLLCVYAGTGVQCFGTILVTMVFTVLGFLSPSNRGEVMTALLSLWAFMGLFAGYISTSLYKLLDGTEWKKFILKTSFLSPGIVFVIFFILTALSWGEESFGAIPFETMPTLALKWFGVSVALVFVDSYVGFKKPAIKCPVKTNQIPRNIPKQAWFMNPVLTILTGGLLPFCVVYTELFFIITSICVHQFYSNLGFLFLAFLFLIITCATSNILHCYYQHCREDYLWWWRSYLTSGSSALYLFLYATYYFTEFTKINFTKPVPAILYFGCSLIGSFAFFVLTGAIGFLASLWSTTIIYSSIKIE